MSSYEIIDLNNWQRAIHYQIFKEYANPKYDISFELDVTHFYQVIKANSWSFTFAMVYMITKAANEIEEFRYRFEEGNVVLYEGIKTSFTYLNQETELMKNIVVEMTDSMQAFQIDAKQVNDSQKEYFTGPMGNDIYQFSSIPWISFTHISHTDSGKKYNAVPMFVWGKMYEKAGRFMLPISVQAHHSFVDGIHMGKLAKKLQDYLNEM